MEPKTPDSDDIRALHSALVSKHATLNQLLWQAPVIALTAQAFLLTIAFDSCKTSFYRTVSGLVATAIGLLSWQLFLRHAAFEKQASIDLEKLEKDFFGKTVHAYKTPDNCSLVASWTSRIIWDRCLLIVSLTGLLPILEHFWNWIAGSPP